MEVEKLIKKDNARLESVHKLAVLALGMPLLCLASAQVGASNWSNIGPEGAHIKQLLMSPSQPGIVYAATNPASYYSSSAEYILKSHNGGQSWVTLPWQGKALSVETIVENSRHQRYSFNFYTPPWLEQSLLIGTSNPDIVFTSLSGYLLKSNDSGYIWNSSGADVELDSNAFFLLNTAPGSISNLLALSGNEIITSPTGAQWSLSNKSINTSIEQLVQPSPVYLTGESGIKLLSTDPDNSSVLYGYTDVRHRSALATLPVLLYKSLDEGQSWQNITPLDYRFVGNKLSFGANNSQIIFAIFAATANGSLVNTSGEDLIMMSQDGGQSWEALSQPGTDTLTYDVTGIYPDPVDNDTLYANIKLENREATENIKAIAKSVDLGKSWQILDSSPYYPGTLLIDPANNQHLLMASRQGILHSENGGQGWNLNNMGVRHIGGKLSVAEDNSQVMYLAWNNQHAVTNSDLVRSYYYKTVDGGQHWDAFTPSPIVLGYCLEFKINPKDNEDIFCLTRDNIYQSKDAGQTWSFLNASQSYQLQRASDGFTIYLSDITGTSKSVDNGVSWQLISSINEGELSIHPEDVQSLYYLLDDSLYVSNNGGMAWEELPVPDNIAFKHLLIHPQNPDVMVLYGTYGYARTEDGGQNWRIILETVNNGDTAKHSFPAEFNFISQLVLHPTDVNRLFLKTNSGIFQSSDQGVNWALLNSGLESHLSGSFVGLHLVSSATDVFADAESGIFKLTGDVDFPALSECLFNWAQQQDAGLFDPAAAMTQQWNGYLYRYYSQSNTYLGIFHEQEIHLYQPGVSNQINSQGEVEFYQELAGCSEALF